jgi:DnaJ-class molecular chaperone
MSTLLLERSPALDEGFERDARRRLDGALLAGTTDAHGRSTLDDLITGVWEGLAVRDTVNCPVCRGSMASRAPAGGHDAHVGTCLGCGSQLT